MLIVRVLTGEGGVWLSPAGDGITRSGQQPPPHTPTSHHPTPHLHELRVSLLDDFHLAGGGLEARGVGGTAMGVGGRVSRRRRVAAAAAAAPAAPAAVKGGGSAGGSNSGAAGSSSSSSSALAVARATRSQQPTGLSGTALRYSTTTSLKQASCSLTCREGGNTQGKEVLAGGERERALVGGWARRLWGVEGGKEAVDMHSN